MTRSTANGFGTGFAALLRPACFAPLLVAASLLVSGLLAARGLPTNDEGGILTLAARILRGAVFYRDLDSYHLPGAPYLLAAWMALFGESVNAARWLAALVFSGLVVGVYLAAVQILDRGRAALAGLGLLSCKVIAAPAFTAYMYSDLALCFAANALALTLGHRFGRPSLRLAAAGLLIALATACKQNVGIYFSAVLVALLSFAPWLLGARRSALRSRAAEAGAYLLGFALAAVPMLGYFGAKGLLPRLVESGLLRPLLQYLPTSGVSFFVPLRWWELGSLRGSEAFPFFVAPFWSMLMNEQLPGRALYGAYWLAGELFSRALYTALPVVFAVVGVRWIRARRRDGLGRAEQRYFVYAALAGAAALTAFPRADLYHVASVYPLVFPLLFAPVLRRGVGSSGRESAAPRRRVPAIAVTALLAASFTLGVASQRLKTYHLRLPRADLHIDPAKAWVETVVKFVDAEVGPGEPLFVYGNEALFYFLSDRYFPWRFPWLYPGQVGPDRGSSLVWLLRRHRPRVVIRGITRWPGLPALSDHAPAVGSYLLLHYRSYPDFFADHPVPAGQPPDAWAVDILLRRGKGRGLASAPRAEGLSPAAQ